MLPLAREFLRYGVEVVLCANSLPAINDITAAELRELIQKLAELCPMIKVHLTKHALQICGSKKILLGAAVHW